LLVEICNCTGKEEHGKKLCRRMRIRRRFVKIEKIGFVFIQHIMGAPEEGEEERYIFCTMYMCHFIHVCKV
jgi:hypothetical protein